MNLLEIKGKTWEVPSKLSELSEEQFLQIVLWLDLPVEPNVREIKILSVILKLRWRFYLKYLIFRVLDENEKFDLQKYAEYFTQKSSIFGEVFFKKIKHKGKIYHCASDFLKNVCFAEFERLAFYYDRIMTDPKALDCLIACLYRPADPIQTPQNENFTGDIRIKFNEHTVERRAKELADLPILKKNAILKYYSACMEHIQLAFADLFPKSDESGEKTTFFDIWHAVAETPKDMQATGEQDLYLILYDLRKKKEKAEKLQDL